MSPARPNDTRQDFDIMAESRADFKALIEAGAPVRDAIRAALGCSFADFAAAHRLDPVQVSRCVNGHRHQEDVREALAAALGVERQVLDAALDAERDRQKAPTAGGAAA